MVETFWGKIIIITNRSKKDMSLKEIIDKFRDEIIKILEIEEGAGEYYPPEGEVNRRFDDFMSCQDEENLNKILPQQDTGIVVIQKGNCDCWIKIDLVECDKIRYLKDDILIESSKIIY